MLLLAFLFVLRFAPEVPDSPLKQPQLAAAGNTVALTYGSGNAIYFARSEDAARTFSKPVKVAEGKYLYLSNHRGPRVIFAGNAIVITAILGDERATHGNLFAWRSTDSGKTWSAGVRVNDVAESAREGLHSVAGARGGVLWAVWLDLREKGMQLFGARSSDGGKTWGPNQRIYASPDGHICQCCHPTAYIGARGELYAMWRNWLNGSRDMHYAVTKDQNNWEVHKLGQGTWPLNACPMDGGGLALDKDGKMYAAWRRGGSVYLTASPSGKEIELGKGKNPALVAAGGGAYVIWTDNADVKLKKPHDAVPEAIGKGGYPAIAGTGPIFAAWEENGAIAVTSIPVTSKQ